jgi:hypothetical protein
MEVSGVKTLTDLLLTTENLLIMIASWFLVIIAKRAAPKFFERPFMVRMLPVLPTFIAVGLVWIPGLRPDMEWGATLILGVVLGWGAGQVHKILSQTVLGRDTRIAPSASQATSKPSEKPVTDSIPPLNP